MTTITANTEIAPDLSGLVAVDSIPGIGIKLQWDIPLTDSNLFATEIWASIGSNTNRSSAELIATVVGNNYFFPALVNETYHFWIRGVTIYGRSNGAWYPADEDAGIDGQALEIVSYLAATPSNTYIGDDTYQLIARITISNQANRNKAVQLLYNAVQFYSSGAVNTTFKLESYNPNTTVTTLLRTYGPFTDKIITPMFIYNVANQSGQTALEYNLYWKGADNTVTLTFPAITANWDFNL